MKIYLLLMIILSSVVVEAFGIDYTTLSGFVRSREDGNSLPGASVYIPDLKKGAITDSTGFYKIDKLPKSKFLIQVRLVGYSSVSIMLDLSIVTEKNFELEISVIEGKEVVITGSAFASGSDQSSLAVIPVDRIEIITLAKDNLVSALANYPGISEVSTGNGISKPVIRGLGYNRIIVMNEGVRQEGQQWGDEHGLEIDQFSAEKVEILKGPSSLLYGSDALGGVINILEPIPVPEGKIKGEFNTHYSFNNLLATASAMMQGHQKGIIWKGRFTGKSSSAYKTPVERVYNSAFNEWSGKILLGLNKSWGYSHFHFTRWEANTGLIEGDRDTETGQFINAEGIIVPTDKIETRKIVLPKQNIIHTKISTVNNFVIGKSQLRVHAGWQQNDRREFEESNTDPGLYFHLNTTTADAKYYFPEKKGIESVVGISGMYQTNLNRGEEFLVPDYTLYDGGAFISAKKTWEHITVNAGLRYDSRNEKGEQLYQNDTILFKAFELSFSAVTGSLGLTWKIGKVFNIKANGGRGFRAPNISELAANGIHEGTFRYEIGNPGLRPEKSIQFDFSISSETARIDLELDLFYNFIDDFIYYRNLNNETINVDGQNLDVFRYVQGESTFYGFEFITDVHIVENIHFENNVSYVLGTNEETNQPLPFIPAMKIQNEIKYELEFRKESRIRQINFTAGADHYLTQDRLDPFETKTSGYTLVNAGLGAEFRIGRQVATFFANVNNLFNEEYYDHLSRLKQKEIYNMGRNITLGMLIPFGIK